MRAVQLLRAKLRLKKAQAAALVEFPISIGVRPRLRVKTHDIDIFEQIFLLRDCEVTLKTQPRFIVDAGAHIGCSTLFFASKFPRASIFAIEADSSNYTLLAHNTNGHPRIQTLHAAVWHKHEVVTIANPNEDPWGYQMTTAEGPGEIIQGLTIREIMLASNFDVIDLLKLDIEGAEREIFASEDLDWMTRTQAILIELHDRFRPGCETTFLEAASRFGFRICDRTSNNVLVER